MRAKINNGTCLINRAKASLPKGNRVALYQAFVEPHIQCAPVWSAAADKHIKTVETAQRNAVKAMANYSWNRTTEQLFEEWEIELLVNIAPRNGSIIFCMRSKLNHLQAK